MADNVTLEMAWADAESALPKNWSLELSVGDFGRKDVYTASATYCWSLRHYREHVGKARSIPFEMAHAATPTEALSALADLLRTRDG